MQQQPMQAPPPQPPVDPIAAGAATAEKRATQALVLGIVSILCNVLTALPAVVLGIDVLTNKAASKAAKTRATVGLVAAVVLSAGFIIFGFVNQELDERDRREEATRRIAASAAAEEREAAELERARAKARTELAQEDAKRAADRERAAAEKARFDALSVDDHLAAAWVALEADKSTNTPDLALKHWTALSGADQMSRKANKVGNELTRRAKARAKADGERAEERRGGYAIILDRLLIDRGIEVDGVEATGRGGKTLRVNYALCGRVFVNDLWGSREAQDALIDMGFERAECRSYFETVSIDLR